MSERVYKDGEIVTFSGGFIDPLTPDPKDVDIRDIGHSLANQCRFTGHTRYFYSVAQHSVLVSQICDIEDALWGLLHDASEAYLSDIARPVKIQAGFGKIYRQTEEKLMKAVSDHFLLEGALPKSVVWADDVMLRSEARDLLPDNFPTKHKGLEEGDYLDYTIDPWLPDRAHSEFMLRFMELG